VPTLAIAIFIGRFAVATLGNIHLGVLMCPRPARWAYGSRACRFRDIVAGFPVNILVLLAGVTTSSASRRRTAPLIASYKRFIAVVGDRRRLLPLVFFAVTAGVAAMGSPQAGYVVMPLAMRRRDVPAWIDVDGRRSQFRHQRRRSRANEPVRHRSPTALLAGRHRSQSTGALGAALVANLALVAAAAWLFPGSSVAHTAHDAETEPAARRRKRPIHLTAVVTLTYIVGLMLSVIIGIWLELEPDIGVIALGFGPRCPGLPEDGSRSYRPHRLVDHLHGRGIVTFVAVPSEWTRSICWDTAAMNTARRSSPAS
jgi:hypothetical protein